MIEKFGPPVCNPDGSYSTDGDEGDWGAFGLTRGQIKSMKNEYEQLINEHDILKSKVEDASEWLLQVCMGCKLHHENNCHDCELNKMNLEPLRKILFGGI